MKYKLKWIQGSDGRDHIASYDLKAKQTYERVKFIMESDLGENVLSKNFFIYVFHYFTYKLSLSHHLQVKC